VTATLVLPAGAAAGATVDDGDGASAAAEGCSDGGASAWIACGDAGGAVHLLQLAPPTEEAGASSSSRKLTRGAEAEDSQCRPAAAAVVQLAVVGEWLYAAMGDGAVVAYPLA
jgi:hypothetical protein